MEGETEDKSEEKEEGREEIEGEEREGEMKRRRPIKENQETQKEEVISIARRSELREPFLLGTGKRFKNLKNNKRKR